MQRHHDHGLQSIGAAKFFFKNIGMRTKGIFGKTPALKDGLCELYAQRARRLSQEQKHARSAKTYSNAEKYATASHKRANVCFQAGDEWERAARKYHGSLSFLKRDTPQSNARMGQFWKNAKKSYELAKQNCIDENNEDSAARMETRIKTAEREIQKYEQGQQPQMRTGKTR